MRSSSVPLLSLLLSLFTSSAAPANPSPAGPALWGRGAVLGAALSPRTLRRVVARQVVAHPDIAVLIPRKPVLGGAWWVGSARDVRFVTPGVVAIDYEDGHLAGRLVVRVIDATDPRTWVVLEDRER